MNIITTVHDTRALVKNIKAQGKRIALVPTMGCLHEGHLSLVRMAKEVADFVMVSIYINPMQFGPNEDLEFYPRTFEKDRQQLALEQTDAIFAPTPEVMYPEGKENHTTVKVDALDGMHCGASRPQFFTGIATVVTKLFNIVNPDIAIFGEKDFQQLCIIKKMVRDLMLPVQIISAPIARASNGLALSSRNTYLSEEQKSQAAHLNKIINEVGKKITEGASDYLALSQYGLQQLATHGFIADYFNIVSQHTLKTPSIDETDLVILAAATLGKTRLIDNLKITLAS